VDADHQGQLLPGHSRQRGEPAQAPLNSWLDPSGCAPIARPLWNPLVRVLLTASCTGHSSGRVSQPVHTTSPNTLSLHIHRQRPRHPTSPGRLCLRHPHPVVRTWHCGWRAPAGEASGQRVNGAVNAPPCAFGARGAVGAIRAYRTGGAPLRTGGAYCAFRAGGAGTGAGSTFRSAVGTFGAAGAATGAVGTFRAVSAVGTPLRAIGAVGAVRAIGATRDTSAALAEVPTAARVQ
jgi:hypothetical protein